MKAVIKELPGKGYSIKQVELPVLRNDEVLIQVKAAGICGTDIPILDGIRQVPLPLIPGHEFSGIVVGKGSEVIDFEVGDKVAPGIVIKCGKCEYCRSGNDSMCENIKEIGIHVNGGFAEFVSVPQQTLHRIPNDMSFIEAASVEPVAAAYRAVRKAAISVGDVVVVFGPGPIGLYAMQMAKAEGAARVVMIGTRESRLRVAEELGADKVINIAGLNPSEIRQRILGVCGAQPSVVIEATGSPQSIPSLFEIVKPQGRVSLCGIFHESAMFYPQSIVRKELEVFGSFCYTWLDFEAALKMVYEKRIKVGPIVTHVLPLEELPVALQMIRSREALKVILEP